MNQRSSLKPSLETDIGCHFPNPVQQIAKDLYSEAIYRVAKQRWRIHCRMLPASKPRRMAQVASPGMSRFYHGTRSRLSGSPETETLWPRRSLHQLRPALLRQQTLTAIERRPPSLDSLDHGHQLLTPPWARTVPFVEQLTNLFAKPFTLRSIVGRQAIRHLFDQFVGQNAARLVLLSH